MPPSKHTKATAPGSLFIISAPSGAGKTSLVKALLENTDQIETSVSHTTRPARGGEIDDSDYHFIDKAEFQNMIDQGVFLEYANVFSNFYGTSYKIVQQSLEAGTDVILEIDWQGAELVRNKLPEAVSIFILPPSRNALKERLLARGQDSEAVIAQRMSQAVSEISHYRDFDYLLINDDFNKALNELQSIIITQRHRCRTQRQRYADLLAELLA